MIANETMVKDGGIWTAMAKRYCVCALFATVPAFWIFGTELFQTYLALLREGDTNYWNLSLSGIFLVVLVMALGRLVRLLFQMKGYDKIICNLAFVACAIASIWYRGELSVLSDRAFFWLNESSFQRKIADGTSSDVLHWRVTDVHVKWFVYSGSRPLKQGRLSPDERAELDRQFDGLVEGCDARSTSLKGNFYVLDVFC